LKSTVYTDSYRRIEAVLHGIAERLVDLHAEHADAVAILAAASGTTSMFFLLIVR